jgi:phosphoesterase RecJ-like protein
MHVSGLIQVLNGCTYILVLSHHNADPDALGAATALSKLLAFCLPGSRVEASAPCGLNKISRQTMPHLPAFSTSVGALENADAVILVDTSTLSQLDELGSRLRDMGKPLVFIDHHVYHPETNSIAALYMVDENASSACEVIFNLYEEVGIQPDKESAQALFLGIAYDTRHFALARSQTFRVAARLVEAGVVAEKMLPLLASPMESSERVAHLKAAQRLQRQSLGRWQIVCSRVGSFQASTARALVLLGAHVAVVGGEQRGKLKISLRSSRDFYEVSGVHLGRDIASRLGMMMGGAGGGHSTAAGFNGEGDLDEAMNYCLNLLREFVDENDKEKPKPKAVDCPQTRQSKRIR